MTEIRSGRGGPLIASADVDDGAWHRVGFVWNGAYRRLYVDDIEVATGAITALAVLAVVLAIGWTVLAGNGWPPESYPVSWLAGQWTSPEKPTPFFGSARRTSLGRASPYWSN